MSCVTVSENMKEVVLVTGATGALGPCIVRELHREGYRIKTFSIEKPFPDLFPNDVEVRIGDISNPKDVRSAMDGIDFVIHLAALLHIVNPPNSLQSDYERINVGGTRNVAESSVQFGVKRLVFFSTIAVYGYSGNQVIDENSPTHPDTYYAQTKLEGEQIVLGARCADGQPIGTVLRLGAVYGSRIKGNYRRLLKSLSRGRFIPIGNGFNRRTLIYDKDVAQAVGLAVKHQAAAGKIFNVSDGKFHTLNEIIEVICTSLGRSRPRISLPVGPVRFAAGTLERLSRSVGCAAPIGRATIDKYTEDVAVDSQRIRTELGFFPKYSLLEGWRETINEMRLAGDL